MQKQRQRCLSQLKQYSQTLQQPLMPSKGSPVKHRMIRYQLLPRRRQPLAQMRALTAAASSSSSSRVRLIPSWQQ
jgi:hypothetical protein